MMKSEQSVRHRGIGYRVWRLHYKVGFGVWAEEKIIGSSDVGYDTFYCHNEKGWVFPNIRVVRQSEKRSRLPSPDSPLEFYTKFFFCPVCGERLNRLDCSLDPYPFTAEQITEMETYD
jgi:hypothetical protein